MLKTIALTVLVCSFFGASDSATIPKRVKRSFKISGAWPDDVVPFRFAPDVPTQQVNDYRGFMHTIEQNTCIRFHEKATNGSNHQVDANAPNTPGWAYIHHDPSRCYVDTYGHKNGVVKASLCTTKLLYVHELGHMLTLGHEIDNYNRREHLFVMLDNTGDVYQYHHEYRGHYEQEKWDNCDFSMQSPLLHEQFYVSKYGWPSYSKLYTSAGVPGTENLYYYFKEINYVHNCCGETSCASSTCANGGYKGMVNGQCRCVCPPGLDEATNCATALSSRRSYGWPSSVTLVEPDGGCPDASFVTGQLKSEGQGSNTVSSPNTMKGTQDATIIETSFCKKDDNVYSGQWNAGSYCFLNNQDSSFCTTHGFHEATVQMSEVAFSGSNKQVNSGNFPTGTYLDTSTTLHLCCRDDGVDFNIQNLPNDKAFLLFKAKDRNCPTVDGMSVREEYFAFDQPAASVITGTVLPSFVENAADNVLTVSYCRYEPVDYSCGGFWTLDSNNPTQSFSTPNYPSNAGTNKECNWGFTVADGSHIVMECSKVDLGAGESFKIRKNLMGDAPMDVHLREVSKSMPPVLSLHNRMMVTFKSGQESSTANGISCTATFKSSENLPYSLNRNGEEYAGTMAYAVDEFGFHQCANWADVFQTIPALYTSPEFKADYHHREFESNYCVNPNGDRLRPWCVTSLHEGNATIRYCDTAQFVAPFNVLDDCTEAMARDTTCALRETKRVCFEECKTAGLITDYPAAETPAKDVTCGQPTLPSGTVNENYDASGYAVGTVVNVYCTGYPAHYRPFMCLSTGQWSYVNAFCTGCPVHFEGFRGTCYHYEARSMKGIWHKNNCESNLRSHLVWPESNTDFDDIVYYRNVYQNKPNNKVFFGLNGNDTGYWYSDFDGSIVQGAHYWKNNAANGIQPASPIHKTWLLPDNLSNAAFRSKLGRCRLDSDGHQGEAICKAPKPSGTGCFDKITTCNSLLELMPDLKLIENDYARAYCKKAMGFCSAVSCTVPATATGVTASVAAGGSVNAGKAVTYSCAAGYTETGTGQRIRACKRDGTLTGQELGCVAEKTEPYQLVYYPMTDDVKYTSQNEGFTGKSVFLKVTSSSKVHACRAYCRKNGNLKIHFWEQGPIGKDFILRQERDVTCIGGMENTWTFATPITVNANEMLGVYDQTGGLIPMHSCVGRQTLDAAVGVRFYNGATPVIGQTYRHSFYDECYVVMVDCLVVPDTYTGTVNIQFRN